MKIFTVGHFKTGTTSYSVAMKQLGYTDLHFPGDYATELTKTGIPPNYTRRPWDSISNLHELEYKQCELVYPDCKFVLTTRNVDNWLRSIKIFMGIRHGDIINSRFEKIFGVPKTSESFNEEHFRKKFLDHEAEVKQYFADKPGRLLVLDLDSGEDLMRKLENFVKGVHKPYPRLNVTRH